MRVQERNEILISNGIEWYLVDYDDGSTVLKHSSALSSIIECGYNAVDFGIVEMQQCWNGEDLSD